MLSESAKVGYDPQTSIGYNYDADSRRSSASITGSGSKFVHLREILTADWKRRMPSMAKGFLRRTAHSRQRLLNYPVRIVTVRLASLGEIGEGFINLLRSLSAA